ncbi:MAG: VWA domain-containing protein [Deltaproteobacteria bacterium]|nr:VWA domain-containing protein [Deltaproteobacteria bacterium]
MKRRLTIRPWAAILLVVCCSPEKSSNRSANHPYADEGQMNAEGAMSEYGTGGISGSNDSILPSGGTKRPESVQSGSDRADDEIHCGSVRIDADVEIVRQNGNLLVVFDRSGSMSAPWGTGTRYEAAGNALISAITPLQNDLTVGGVFFPSLPDASSTPCNPADPLHWIPGPGAACLNLAGVSCDVSDITSSDQINFTPAPQFISQLPQQWFLNGAGMTPLELAVAKANAALSSATLTGTVAVVIMTDGEPTCADNMAVVEATIADWASRGIKTYVVGLPGSAGASAVLNQLAAAGGTNSLIEPSDPAALQAQFSTIVTETIKSGITSCVINLVQTRDADIEKLQMIVVEDGEEKNVLREMAGGGGWSVTPDGTVATLEGSLCDDAKNGRFESIRFDFGCLDIPTLQ